MTLAPHVAAVARGPGRARPLTRDEARGAMTLMLTGGHPEATGALLMCLRYRGETPAEIAGFAEACRVPAWEGIGAALDWPSYAAGRTRGAPLFLAAACLVARTGVPVLIHGHNSHQGGAASVADALLALGIPQVRDPAAARDALARHAIAYAPLGAVNPGLLRLLRLRDELGLRSCANTVARMLNPARAPAAVQGVFHPPYRTLQTEAAALLGRTDLAILKGGGGEFEANPSKPLDLHGLTAGAPWDETTVPAFPARRLHDPAAPMPAPRDALAGRADPFATACIRLTAALALRCARPMPLPEAGRCIDAVWPERRTAA
ncbi:MAG: glycosyl transferase family protein [Hasllibacter sp.]